MSSTQRIDDIINGITPEPEKEVETKQAEAESSQDEEVLSSEREIDSDDDKEEAEPEREETAKDLAAKSESVEEEKTRAETDEYGLEIPKTRMYTEEELQQKIRDRLSRGHAAQQQHQNVSNEVAKDFKADPNSDEPWEAQLESFVSDVIERREKQNNEREWRQREQERQVNFEAKFTTGMDKFNDFHDVVGKLPITDSIMMSIRDMKDPATFLYAAAKLQPEEVKRIAALTDPYQQAAEIGRLDERMRKAKNISKTAAPLKQTKSDVVSKSNEKPKHSIDALIAKHAKSKVR